MNIRQSKALYGTKMQMANGERLIEVLSQAGTLAPSAKTYYIASNKNLLYETQMGHNDTLNLTPLLRISVCVSSFRTKRLSVRKLGDRIFRRNSYNVRIAPRALALWRLDDNT